MNGKTADLCNRMTWDKDKGGPMSYLTIGLLQQDPTLDIKVGTSGTEKNPGVKYLRDHGVDAKILTPDETSDTIYVNVYKTIFVNGEKIEHRIQSCLHASRPVTSEDVMRSFGDLPQNSLVVVGPLTHENYSASLAQDLAERGNALVFLPQGDFRQTKYFKELAAARKEDRTIPQATDTDSITVFKEPSANAERIAELSALMIISNEDTEDIGKTPEEREEYEQRLYSLPKVTILTKGERGCTLFINREAEGQITKEFPAFAMTIERENQLHHASQETKGAALTGLGEKYTSALLSAEMKGLSLEAAIAYASVYATTNIELALEQDSKGRRGPEGAPTPAELQGRFSQPEREARLRQYLDLDEFSGIEAKQRQTLETMLGLPSHTAIEGNGHAGHERV